MLAHDLLQMHNRFNLSSVSNSSTLDNVLRILDAHNFSPSALRCQIDFNKFSICAAISISLFSTPIHEQIILEKCLNKLQDLLTQKVSSFNSYYCLLIKFVLKSYRIYH